MWTKSTPRRIGAAERGARILPPDGEDRRASSLVQPFNRWMAPGPEVAKQTPSFTGEFRMGAAMNGGHFLVTSLDELIVLLAFCSAPMMPLMPSPGQP